MGFLAHAYGSLFKCSWVSFTGLFYVTAHGVLQMCRQPRVFDWGHFHMKIGVFSYVYGSLLHTCIFLFYVTHMACFKCVDGRVFVIEAISICIWISFQMFMGLFYGSLLRNRTWRASNALITRKWVFWRMHLGLFSNVRGSLLRVSLT